MWLRRLVWAVCIATVATGAAHSVASAETRVALVIANGDYDEIPELENPPADGRLIADRLDALGFRTTLLIDAEQDEMKRAIASFGRELRAAGRETVGLFYYAGHGIQADGRNYLIPTEAEPKDPADLDLVAVEANWVLRQMESAGNQTNIIILDACRNNPLPATGRSLERGLARIDAPTGSFIAYPTAPGQTAVDGDGDHSPFTEALARAMDAPGAPIEQVFKQVRIEVLRATGGRQTPWDSSSLVQDFYFRPPAGPSAGEAAVVDSLWESVSRSGDPGRIALFLEIYPNSTHAPAARELLAATAAGAPTAEARARGATPKASEHAMIDRAQASGEAADYRAYLDAYPEGVFADLARAEIAHLEASIGDGGKAAPQPAATLSLFDRPIGGGPPGIREKSIHELSMATPKFPPVDGLPADVWQDKRCSTCHNWSRENLCQQGGFYVKTGDEALARKRHPFGGAFKRALRNWAAAGCDGATARK